MVRRQGDPNVREHVEAMFDIHGTSPFWSIRQQAKAKKFHGLVRRALVQLPDDRDKTQGMAVSA